MKLVKVTLKSGKVVHVLPQEVAILKEAKLIGKNVKNPGATKELKDKGLTK